MKQLPYIDMIATGRNIEKLRTERGLTVRQVSDWFGFTGPQAVYKWQNGQALPTVDNLYALGTLFEIPMEEILVEENHIIYESQDESCGSVFLTAG